MPHSHLSDRNKWKNLGDYTPFCITQTTNKNCYVVIFFFFCQRKKKLNYVPFRLHLIIVQNKNTLTIYI